MPSQLTQDQAKKEEASPNADLKEALNRRSSPWYIDQRHLYLIEHDMIRALVAIKSRAQWWIKCQDPEIVATWKRELREQSNLSDAVIDYVFDEIRWHAGRVDVNCRVSPVDGVFEADNIIPEDIRQKVILAFQSVLSSLPEVDFHPGSDDKVVNVIHPSLFPMVFGVSRTINDVSAAQIDPLDVEAMINASLLESDCPKSKFKARCFSSDKYQWIPSELDVYQDSVKFKSYINNLHPERFSEVYGLLEYILNAFVPLFNQTLSCAVNTRPERVSAPDVVCLPRPLSSLPEMGESMDDSDVTDEDMVEALEHEWYSNKSHAMYVVVPSKDKFECQAWESWMSSTINLRPPQGSSGPRRLQVIVKVASIELTPEKPTYDGGSWHVEGMQNEMICATGLYYYDSDNITDSKLAFRESCDEPCYEQGDSTGVRAMYGLGDHEEAKIIQPLGAIETRTHQMIAFPNSHQHQVQPFRLADPSRPGSRKIIAFFLISPTTQILSTRTIIPQNKSWWPATVTPPAEYDIPFNLDKAKEYRKDLMTERGKCVQEQNEEVYEREFSLCEH